MKATPRRTRGSTAVQPRSDMEFIPPDTAIYEAGVEHPRSFEINDLPPQ